MNLEKVLNFHKLWLAGDGEGKRANLYRADLSGANLSGADLFMANLYQTDLSGANLSETNLRRANLCRADLSGANLCRADLSGVNLYQANLSGADLSGADLSGADLCRADLRVANLDNTILSPLREGKVVEIANIHYALFDPRGYVLSYDGDMFASGCREFDYEAAIAHWKNEDYPDRKRGDLYVKAVKSLRGA